MGVNLADIVPSEQIELEHLTGRKIAIDAYNTLYQFLSIIRQPDGTPLMNSKGQVTSHLSGLLYRTAKLVQGGVKPCFVFDGLSPEEKRKTIAERIAVRVASQEKWDEAKERGDIEESRMYAQQATRLTFEMVEQSKRVLGAMGIPFVDAPSEGEAQAAFMAVEGSVWGVSSQDFDSLLFGAPVLVRNMSITGKRKVPRKKVYVVVKPELIKLEEALASLQLSREQLVELALLVGTDFNEGVKGIGPKKGLALIQKGETASDVFSEQGLDTSHLDGVRDIFLKPNVTKKYSLEWTEPDTDALVSILCEEFDFSRERVNKVVGDMTAALDIKGTQSRLDQW